MCDLEQHEIWDKNQQVASSSDHDGTRSVFSTSIEMNLEIYPRVSDSPTFETLTFIAAYGLGCCHDKRFRESQLHCKSLSSLVPIRQLHFYVGRFKSSTGA